MGKIFKFGFVIFLFLLLCWTVIVLVPAAPNHSLDIQIRDKGLNNSNHLMFIVISNASDNAVTYYGEAVWIAFLNKGIWETNSTGEPRDEDVLLHPHRVIEHENYNEIPPGTTAVKAGIISYTSLTWRGDFAWNISSGDIRKPIADFLIQLDLSKRSKTESSSVVYLNATTNNATR